MPEPLRRILPAVVIPAMLLLGLFAINRLSTLTVSAHDDWDDTTTVRTFNDSEASVLWKAAEKGELIALNPMYRVLAAIGYVAAEIAIVTGVGMGLFPTRRILRILTAIGALLGLLVLIGYMRLAAFAATYAQIGGEGQTTVRIGPGPLVFGIACLAAAALTLLLPRLRRRSPRIVSTPVVSPVESS